MVSAISQLAVDANDVELIAHFWCSVLGWTELDRLIGLGATPVEVGQRPDVSWTVLADPEGNEFCLLSRTVQEVVDAAG